MIQRFEELKQILWEETAYHSDMSVMHTHWANQEIISMGMDVVPIILRDLMKKPQWWMYTLTEITGENPCPERHAGILNEMTNDWLEWGVLGGMI